MASPDSKRSLEIDGLMWDLEVWGKRVLAFGPRPSRRLFFSFSAEVYENGDISWGMADQVLARRVNEYIKKHPDRWAKWYGEDGIYTKEGRE